MMMRWPSLFVRGWSEHYTVDIVADGEQETRGLHESEYDIVVLDLNLPKLDGVSVLRHLRLKKPSFAGAGA